MPLVAGIDSSAHAATVEVRDADSGALVARGRARVPATSPAATEVEPGSWWDAVVAAWADAGAPEVVAVSVAAPSGCVVLGEDRRPLRAAKLWNDASTAPDADWLTGQLPGGRAGWAQACGSVPSAALAITKLSWLHRSEPDTWAALRHVCLPHDWLTSRLCGELVTDRGDASVTGYWSPSQGAYRFDLLAIVDADLDWAPMLPRVLGPIEPAGDWRDTVVGPGTGDRMAAALGLGLAQGDAVIAIGSRPVVAVVSDTAAADPSGTVAGLADATGRFLAAVTVPADLGAVAADLAAGAGAAGGPEVIQRVACELLDELDALADHVPIDGHLWLVGAGGNGVDLGQALADLSGREVRTSHLDDVVATGACVQATAVWARRDPGEVRAEWSLGTPTTTGPALGPDRAQAIRSAAAQLRDRG